MSACGVLRVKDLMQFSALSIESSRWELVSLDVLSMLQSEVSDLLIDSFDLRLDLCGLSVPSEIRFLSTIGLQDFFLLIGSSFLHFR